MGQQRLGTRIFPSARGRNSFTALVLSSSQEGGLAMGQNGPHSQVGLTALLSPFPSPACDSAPRYPGCAQRRCCRIIISSDHTMYKMLQAGNEQDTHPKRQWSSGAPQMEQTKLQDWDSHMHHPAKPTHRDISCPHQHLLWQQEPVHPRCQRSYPKKCPSRAAAPLGCKQCVPQET